MDVGSLRAVYGDYYMGVPYSGRVLDSPRDPAGDVELGGDFPGDWHSGTRTANAGKVAGLAPRASTDSPEAASGGQERQAEAQTGLKSARNSIVKELGPSRHFPSHSFLHRFSRPLAVSQDFQAVSETP